ncbi:MAG: hypothetical protein ACYSXF_09625, partial [Planctomycetota bacterium]
MPWRRSISGGNQRALAQIHLGRQQRFLADLARGGLELLDALLDPQDLVEQLRAPLGGAVEGLVEGHLRAVVVAELRPCPATHACRERLHGLRELLVLEIRPDPLDLGARRQTVRLLADDLV